MNITGGFRKLKQDLKGMTLRQKLEHLWTYYRWVILVAVCVVVVIGLIVSCYINLNTNTLLAGAAINVDLGDEGTAYLTEEFQTDYGTGVRWEETYLNLIYLEDFETTKNYQDNYYTLMSLLALCTEKELDYIIADQIGMENMLKQQAFMDLSSFFTADELTALGNKVIMARSSEQEMDESVPTVVDITELPFIQKYVQPDEDDKVYFGVVQNSPRTQTIRELWDYLNSWSE